MSKSRDIADSAATINYIDNVTSDVQSQINTLDTALDNISVTSGTLTKTFASGESASINLTSSVLAPVVSVTKEVPQSGVTNNNWDVNSTTENYTRLDSAYATTLDWVAGDIDSGSYSSNSYGVTTQATEPRGMKVSSDGTKAYVVDGTTDSIYQYSLPTAFDISTASYNSVSLSVASQTAEPVGIVFNNDGTKLYITSLSPDAIYQYSLSTAFDLSTASYDSKSFSVASQDGNAYGVAFNSDGTKMYMCGVSTDSVYQYSLSTAFDVSTASYDSVSFSVASGSFVDPSDLGFNSDGTKMYVISRASDDIRQYSLSTAFDLSTASYDSIELTTAEDSNMWGMSINSSGSKIYLTGNSTDTLYEYDVPLANLALGTGSFASADVGKTIEANSGEFVLTATDGSYVETTAPTSYEQVASGSWEMYGVVYNAADGDLELSSTKINLFDLSTASYSQDFYIGGEESSPYSIRFNTNGTKMFVLGGNGQDVNEYTLSTGFDVSTASFIDSFSVSSQDTNPTGLDFNSDGTKMFVVGNANDNVYEYSLSTGFDVSTSSYVRSFSISAKETSPSGLKFSTDGTKMFILGEFGSATVHEYALSTAFNISTASFVSSFSVSSNDSEPRDIDFNNDGTKMFLVGNQTNSALEYSLATAFTISSASFVDSFSVSSQESTPTGICFNSDGSKMFVVGTSSDDVNEYSMGSTAFPTGYHPVHTTASIDSTYWTDINSMTADQAAGDGNVYYAISTDGRTTWTVIDNTDGERDIVRNNAGTWQYNSNGTYASETWTNATTNTELAALAEAMEGASETVGYLLANASYDSITFATTSQATAPRGVAFKSDGTKMYVVDFTNKAIYQYSLSTAWNQSTATYDSVSFSVNSQTPNSGFGIEFKPDGTAFYISDSITNIVYQYSLSTAWDLSTASYASKSFNASSQDTDVRGARLGNSGTKLYILGNTNDTVFQYTLSTAWDISTASYDSKSFSVLSQDNNVLGLALNPSGTKLFIGGSNSDSIYEYSLSTAWDISTASYSSISLSVASQAATPVDLVFGNSGTKLYLIDYSNDQIERYSTSSASYPNQMDKTQLDAVTDPNHIALGNDLDLSIIFNMTSGTTVPSSDGVAINYDATVLNKGAVLGTDYDFDAPAGDKARITALTAGNFKVRVV